MTAKYFTISAETPSSIGDNILKLCKENIILSHTLMLREALADIGIYIRNKSEIPYTLEWTDKSKSEAEIIEYIKRNYKMELTEITATVDFSKFLQKFSDGQIDGVKREPITEEVLGADIQTKDIYEKITAYLNNIKSNVTETKLIITDPWLLQIDETQMKDLIDILKVVGVTDLTVYTEKKGNKDNFEKKLEECGIKFTIYKTDMFHDRFWIIGEKGIVVGTSFNSIGKKIALLDYISDEDVKTIRKYIDDNDDKIAIFD